jgi:hypothetical protein
LPESTIAAYNARTHRFKPGATHPAQTSLPPDAETIRRLNELAAKTPFCICFRVKKYDLL